MSNIGRKFPSEMETFVDKKTGNTVTKLTKTGINVHFYFTDNSFTTGDKDILYYRCEGTAKAPGVPELFRMDLETGERTQESDFRAQFHRVGNFTKTPDSEYVVFVADNDLYSYHLPTHTLKLICRCPVGYTLGHPSISFDKKYVAFAANDIPDRKVKYVGENYGGFKEQFYAHKNSRLMLVTMDGSDSVILFEDTHWMGHVQFAPDTNEYITYCHEGPWNYVQQRIWMFNTVTRRVKPCFVQEENDSVGHEFWTRDGLVFFDNRGRGHDGTITSDKTQAVTVSQDGPDDIPWVCFCDKECRIVRRLELPFYCNHYHANKDNTLLVADAVNDLVLIDISTDEPRLSILAEHNTSWRYQRVHCHPCFSWSNDKILYASDADDEGMTQLYLIRRT